MKSRSGTPIPIPDHLRQIQRGGRAVLVIYVHSREGALTSASSVHRSTENEIAIVIALTAHFPPQNFYVSEPGVVIDPGRQRLLISLAVDMPSKIVMANKDAFYLRRKRENEEL
jgi:hypothetical protein